MSRYRLSPRQPFQLAAVSGFATSIRWPSPIRLQSSKTQSNSLPVEPLLSRASTAVSCLPNSAWRGAVLFRYFNSGIHLLDNIVSSVERYGTIQARAAGSGIEQAGRPEPWSCMQQFFFVRSRRFTAIHLDNYATFNDAFYAAKDAARLWGKKIKLRRRAPVIHAGLRPSQQAGFVSA